MFTPQHPAKRDFNKARDEIDYRERQLSDEQRPHYEELLKKQKAEREEQKKRIERAKNAQEEERKRRKPQKHNRLDPPFKTNTHEATRLAAITKAQIKKAKNLERKHETDRLDFLKIKNRELKTKNRERQLKENACQITARRAAPAFNRAADDAKKREQALVKAFENVKARDDKQNKEIEKDKSLDDDPDRQR